MENDLFTSIALKLCSWSPCTLWTKITTLNNNRWLHSALGGSFPPPPPQKKNCSKQSSFECICLQWSYYWREPLFELPLVLTEEQNNLCWSDFYVLGALYSPLTCLVFYLSLKCCLIVLKCLLFSACLSVSWKCQVNTPLLHFSLKSTVKEIKQWLV